MDIKFHLLSFFILYVLRAVIVAEEHQDSQATVSTDFCFDANHEGFRLNLTVLMKKVVPQMIVCVIECAKEPCCRSINYKKTLSSHNEPNCEMLQDVVNSTSQKFLERNGSYDHVHILNPEKEYNASCFTTFLDGNTKDIDECSKGSHKCDENANCTNTNGSFKCKCEIGYSGDGRTCKDIDECSVGSPACDGNANCTNTNGSFKCKCEIGYSGDGHTCKDIDECSEGSDTCDENANCTNTDGSFECQCKIGFSGHGHTCTDIDECSEGSHKCDKNATCININGSFICQSGSQTCKDILSENDNDILKSWIGMNYTAKLCWRATRDGWSASTFHSNCDNKKPTVTIVKVDQYVFGGYATESWDGSGHKQAPGSFIFSLRNKENLPPFKAPLIDQNDGCAIYTNPGYGPAFGRDFDMKISYNPASNAKEFGTTYQPPSGISESKTILAGTQMFRPLEVEVFYLV